MTGPHSSVGLLQPGGAAHQRVDARKQFLDVEGLDQVIVGALLEAFDLVLPARTGGQDQDGEFLAFVAQGLDQLHARHLGRPRSMMPTSKGTSRPM
jgi:hypothetical protein